MPKKRERPPKGGTTNEFMRLLLNMPGAFSFIQLPPCFPERKGASHRIFQNVRGIEILSGRHHVRQLATWQT